MYQVVLPSNSLYVITLASNSQQLPEIQFKSSAQEYLVCTAPDSGTPSEYVTAGYASSSS